ncbi:MAG TPA: IS1182 family transposase [Bacteroidales bacterium]|nr:IS1182 family transposase [Bacteroidales bacterium]
MAKYRHFSYEQGVMIAVNFNDQIVEGSIEHTINWLVDNKIDLTVFENRYRNDSTGAPAYHPGILLKIILLAYSRGIISSREIARACRENIQFMALSANTQPDFTTIAWFVRSMKDDVMNIFVNILLVCSEMDLLGGTEFALDGCKMRSNASKEWSGTFSDLAKKKDKIEKTVDMLMNKHRIKDIEEASKKSGKKDDINRRIEKLKSRAEKIERFLDENTPKGKSRTGEAQSNITDNESAKMKTSHGVLQGYNGMALVDSRHQVIVHAEAFGTGHEHDLLVPMIEGAKISARSIGLGNNYYKEKRIIADTGSFKEENLEYLSMEKIDAYIPDQQYRKRDPRFATMTRHKNKSDRPFTKDDFTYDKAHDIFICPTGKVLKLSVKQKLANTEGRRYISSRSNCNECKLRKKCLRSDKARYRTLYVVERYFNRNYSDEMKRKIDTAKGREVYSRRMGIVEPVFGNIRSSRRLDHYTLRTKAKVNIQWLLFAMVHNICKINRYADICEAT